MRASSWRTSALPSSALPTTPRWRSFQRRLEQRLEGLVLVAMLGPRRAVGLDSVGDEQRRVHALKQRLEHPVARKACWKRRRDGLGRVECPSVLFEMQSVVALGNSALSTHPYLGLAVRLLQAAPENDGHV